MADTLSTSNKIEWKSAANILLLYVIFYLTPILIARGLFSSHVNNHSAYTFLGIWIFSGAIVTSAIGGYLSKARTLREPAIAGAALLILWVVTAKFLFPPGRSILYIYLPMVPTLGAIFFLSLLGAWLGERAQTLGKSKHHDETASAIAPISPPQPDGKK
ncbi:MAG: hypothetical protein WBD36_06085 [Bacteroidota bacterium]